VGELTAKHAIALYWESSTLLSIVIHFLPLVP